jgi:hypothetical protein
LTDRFLSPLGRGLTDRFLSPLGRGLALLNRFNEISSSIDVCLKIKTLFTY